MVRLHVHVAMPLAAAADLLACQGADVPWILLVLEMPLAAASQLPAMPMAVPMGLDLGARQDILGLGQLWIVEGRLKIIQRCLKDARLILIRILAISTFLTTPALNAPTSNTRQNRGTEMCDRKASKQ